MRASDIREQTPEELATRLNDVKKNLFNLKFQKAIGQLKNTQSLRNIRKDIAMVETLIREKQLGLNKNLIGKKAETTAKKIDGAEANGKKRAVKVSKKTKDESIGK